MLSELNTASGQGPQTGVGEVGSHPSQQHCPVTPNAECVGTKLRLAAVALHTANLNALPTVAWASVLTPDAAGHATCTPSSTAARHLQAPPRTAIVTRATILRDPKDLPFGRLYSAADLEGHASGAATRSRSVTPGRLLLLRERVFNFDG